MSAVILRRDWRDRAACRGMDPDLFFPEPGEKPHKAKAACAACPVRAECLSHAVNLPERHGVWGGLNERERYGMGPHEQPPQFRKAAPGRTAAADFTPRAHPAASPVPQIRTEQAA